MKVIISLIFLFSTGGAFAHERDLEMMVERQVVTLEKAETQSKDHFKLTNVSLLTRLELEVEVPVVAKFTIRPEIELHWSR